MSLNKKIYLVGGAVRDKLMGIPINDKDYVAVGYSENEFSHLQKVGKDFPVFLLPDSSEIALARVERKTSSGYNGFSTETKNVTLLEDLSRRDLTINSIAYDETTKRYIDPYNGQEDIKKKLLKHTSKAFIEDPLRVLRIARFRAKLGIEWSIDNSTKELIISMKEELLSLQADRVYKEIVKASDYKEFYLFFQTLYELDVLESIFPQMGEFFKDNEKHFFIAMDYIKNISNQPISLKLAGLFYFVFKDSIEKVNLINDLKLPKKTEFFILSLLKKHSMLFQLDHGDIFECENFFRNCKRDKELLEAILFFNKTLLDLGRKHHLCIIAGELNDDVLLGICNEISSYSPKIWLESFVTKPSNSKISSHIQDYNLQVINKYKQLHKKLFVL